MKVIKLNDGNKYIVANELYLEGRKFYQLFDYNCGKGFFVAEKIGGNLTTIEDETLLRKIAVKLIFEKNKKTVC